MSNLNKRKYKCLDGKTAHQSDEYNIWRGIKTRCYNKNNKSFKYYGGKGIQMCEKWKNSFEAFYNDMGKRPTKKHSIDRIDANKEYCPENCRWATYSIQSKNRKGFNKKITYKNETLILKDWAKKFNINYTTLIHRLYKQKLSFEIAVTKPIKTMR